MSYDSKQLTFAIKISEASLAVLAYEESIRMTQCINEFGIGAFRSDPVKFETAVRVLEVLRKATNSWVARKCATAGQKRSIQYIFTRAKAMGLTHSRVVKGVLSATPRKPSMGATNMHGFLHRDINPLARHWEKDADVDDSHFHGGYEYLTACTECGSWQYIN